MGFRIKHNQKNMWYLYILECRDGSYYTGITQDIPARLDKHNSGKGAKYTKSRRPVKLVYSEKCKDGRVVRRREREVKSWPRARKEALIRSNSWSSASPTP